MTSGRPRDRRDDRGGSSSWPEGITSAGVSAGVKAGDELDLGLLVADRPVAWAGTFTRNAAAAASVIWSRSRLGAQVRALVVNSGNANACTGDEGEAAVETTTQAAASAVGCDAGEVLVASTGPIGVQLPVDRIVAALPDAFGSLSQTTGEFARSILTTDTRVKVTEGIVGPGRLVGVAKGAAMLAPNMATMLAFLAVDGPYEAEVLQAALERAVARTFDRISVDECESTNDSVFLLATGRGAPAPSGELEEQVESACADLAEQIVRDAEGGSKLVRIRVSGARTEDVAAALGRAVAGSVLWRAATFGGDPNWGRILAALGAADRTLDLRAVNVSIGPSSVFARGIPATDLAEAAKHMAGDEIAVSCVVGDGPGSAEILTSDLSPDYVTLNAYGTT